MKSVKKMLSLLLVAMLLVTAIPFAASADGEIANFEESNDVITADLSPAPGVTTELYSVLYAVNNSGSYYFSSVLATFNIASDANDDAIRAAAANAVGTVTADAIVQKVSANGNSAAVHNVVYGTISTYVDRGNHELKYILEVSPRPSVSTEEVTMPAAIFVDAENTGIFEDSGKTVNVTLIKTIVAGSPATYSLKANGGATVTDIKGALGANYANKNLSFTIQGPSAVNGEVTYRVTVTGSNGSTGTNVPIYDGNNGNNNGGTGIGGGTGTGSGTGSGTGTVAQFKVTFLNVNGVEFYSEYVTANHTIAASADFLNSSVGTREGYEHIGWKANSGSTKTTNVVLTDRINANVTYAPVFRNLTNNSVVIPGGGSSSVSGGNSSGSSSGTNKFPYPVYLNIYKDTLVGSPDKRVEITNGIALDGLVSLDEVKTVVKNYYNAKDSDGIKYDGLYIAAGNWVAEYVADTSKYDSIDAGSMRQTGTVYINVMITNATAKSSATADSSNPKTGDTIFVPVMVMGVTATALAAAYVFGKKRIAR